MNVLPERSILTLLNNGVGAIVTDLGASAPGSTVLDDILEALPAAELTKARAYFTSHAPQVIMGFPRGNTTYPCYALTLTGDDEANRYIGTAEHDEAVLGVKQNVAFNLWTGGRFTIWVYAEHPDICAWYYRVLRRIMQVGIQFLISEGLDNPSISGAEMAPDPRYTPDNLFVRRLTLNCEYDEEWPDNDALWLAINGPPEAFIVDPDQLDVRHVDSYPTDPLEAGDPGGVVPIEIEVDVS